MAAQDLGTNVFVDGGVTAGLPANVLPIAVPS